MARQHARLGASNAHIWMVCTAQPAFTEGMERKSSEAAAEGTLAHTISEVIRDGFPPPSIGSRFKVEGYTFEIDTPIRDGTRMFVDITDELIEKANCWGQEERVTLTPLLPTRYQDEEVFGTCDFWMLEAETRTLHVVDLKYGRGKSVEAEENVQLLFYALGVAIRLEFKGFDNLHIEIVQPRTNKPIRHWNIGIYDLIRWATRTLIPTIEVIMEGRETTFEPGDHCWFCPGKSSCLALQQYRQLTSIKAFETPYTIPEEMEI